MKKWLLLLTLVGCIRDPGKHPDMQVRRRGTVLYSYCEDGRCRVILSGPEEWRASLYGPVIEGDQVCEYVRGDFSMWGLCREK